MELEAALREVDRATSEVSALQGSMLNAQEQLKARVRTAFRAGASQAELARRTGKHRNTIAHWCD